MSYFKVGEEVILQSVSAPELNGECSIIKVLPKIPRKIWFSSNESDCRTVTTHTYITTIPHSKGFSWGEPALRKKHKPSTKSLSTMIEELNKVKA